MNEQTSKRVASMAGKLLASLKEHNRLVKAVAASALTQAPNRRKRRKQRK